MGLLEKLGLTAPRPRVAQADVAPAADVARLRGEVAAPRRQARKAQIATAEAAPRRGPSGEGERFNSCVAAPRGSARPRPALRLPMHTRRLRDARRRRHRRRDKECRIATPQLESDRQRVFVR
jgi:hypothetical protein